MSRDFAAGLLFAVAMFFLALGKWEAGLFVGMALVLVALLGPTDEQVDAYQRNRR